MPVDGGGATAEDLVDSAQWGHVVAADDGLVAVDSAESVFHVDARTGAIRWRHTRARHVERVAVVGERLVTIARQGADAVAVVTALRDGRTIATTPINMGAGGGEILPLAESFVVAGPNALAAFDVADGRLRWRFEPEQPFERRLFVAQVDRAVWADAVGGLRCVELTCGAIRWTTQLAEAADADWIISVDAGRSVVIGRSDMLVCLDGESGYSRWRRSGRAMPFAQPPTLWGDDLLLVQRVVPVGDRANGDSTMARYLVRRIDTISGESKPTTSDSDFVVGPFATYGGVYPFADGLVVVDWSRIESYATGSGEGKAGGGD